MPFVYIYSPSDFIGGLPNEQGAQAAGSGPWNLTLAPGAQPTVIEISDDDLVFDEVDSNQVLAGDVNIDGTSYSSGTTVHTAYDLWNSSTGHKITSVHFGGTGYEQGAVHGVVSTVELQPGTTYTFNRERTSHQQNNEYTDYVACFASGSRIETPHGPIPVEQLKSGDEICTACGEVRVLRLALNTTVSADDLARNEKLHPVRITAGSLGAGLPKHDLLVSPQHRMLANVAICKRMFGTEELFLSAIKLTALPGIYVDTSLTGVTYHHLVFDQHEVILAEGAPTESFYCGDQALYALTKDVRAEISALFGDMPAFRAGQNIARFTPKGREQNDLLQCLAKNGRSVLTQNAA